MRSICVFCGANFNGDLELLQAVNNLADVFVEKDITLIFGGGRVGVMGLIADAVLVRGGKAIGVIPQFLMDKEVGHTGLTELIITEIYASAQAKNGRSFGRCNNPAGWFRNTGRIF